MLQQKTNELPPASASSELVWKTYTEGNFDEGMQLWRHLERRLNSQSVSCSPTWVDCWIRNYGALVPCRIVTASTNGDVRGICLLTEGVGKSVGPFPVKTRHVGTAGEPQPGSVCVEYNRVLVEPHYHSEFVAGIAQSIHDAPHWDQFHLDGFTETDIEPWLQMFPDAELRRRDSKFFNLKETRDAGDEILSRLGKSTRANIRRQLRKYGQLDCEWARSVEQAEEIFQELISLHQARWTAVGEVGAFANERFLKFQQELVIRLFMEQRVVLFRVRHQGETVGCLLLLVDENRLLDYLSGFAPFDQKPSPGLITHYLCMSEALSRGFDAYDFLVGEKRHKENLSTDVHQLCWLTWSRSTFKMKSIETIRQAQRALKRLRSH